MGRKRVESPKGEKGVIDVLKALDSLDSLNRRSGTMRRVPNGEDAADAAPVWESEPDTQRFVESTTVAVSSESLRVPASERRAARRVALEVPVRIGIEGEEVGGTSEDISLTGIFVRTERLLHSGRRVDLRFDLPHGVIEVTGVVVRFRTPSKSAPGGVGLCFQALSPAQAECIEAYCDSCTDSIR